MSVGHRITSGYDRTLFPIISIVFGPGIKIWRTSSRQLNFEQSYVQASFQREAILIEFLVAAWYVKGSGRSLIHNLTRKPNTQDEHSYREEPSVHSEKMDGGSRMPQVS